MKIKSTVLVIAVALSIGICATGFTSIGSGEVGVKTVFGVAQSLPLQPGIQLKIPIVDQITVYDTRTQSVPEVFSTLTKDGQLVKVTEKLGLKPRPSRTAFS